MVGLGTGLAVTYAGADDLDPPTGLTAKALSPTSVELDWTASEHAESYVIRVGADRALSAGTTKQMTVTRKTSLTLADLAAAMPGVDQYYRVDAVRDGKVRSSRTGRFALRPGVVGKVTVVRASADGVKVAWKAVPNARQYDVVVARDKKFTTDRTAVRTLGGDRTFVTRGLKAATTYWLKVRPVNGDQAGVFSPATKFTTAVTESSFRLGTWNVCSEKCSGYAGRARIMADFLNASKVDIFGLQEAGGQRVGATTNAIFSGGSRTFRRATGGAKARYIFYRPALFTQLSGGSFGIGDGRDTTWAKFKVKKTRRIFYFVDVHLENGKGNDGRRSREMNAMLARMAQINDTGKPMVYAGDFNSGRHRRSDSPGVKMRAAGLTDSVDLAKDPINERISTSHSFSTRVLAARAHVDHIWVSKDFQVLQWHQLVRLVGGRYAKPVVSDHNALSAVLALDANRVSVGEPTVTTVVAGLTGPIG